MYHVHDDHDISNDYDQGEETSIYKNATQAFSVYHRNANPAPVYPDVNYFIMDYGDTSFFYLDTRRYRSRNIAPDGCEKSMLGQRQLVALLKWLRKCEKDRVTWKFIVSSVPMTNNWKGPDGQRDTWGGFMHERSIILDAIAEISNVVVISGVYFLLVMVNGRIVMKLLSRRYLAMSLKFRYRR
jgi:alkaline phosphatase D